MKFFFIFFFLSFFLVGVLKANIKVELLKGEAVFNERKIIYSDAHLKIITNIEIWEIKAGEILYDGKKEQMLMQKEVIMEKKSLRIKAEKILLNTKTGLIEITKGFIVDTKNNIQINAEKITQKKKNSYITKKAFLTSCIVSEQKMFQTWRLYANNLDYFVDNYAVGKGALLYIGKAPVFYSPALVWPTTSKRQSGLLAPSIAYKDSPEQEAYGLQIKLPYYLAITPHINYTLDFDLRQRRGIGLGHEYHQVGKKSAREISIDAWSLSEKFNERVVDGQSFSPFRYFLDGFYYEPIYKNQKVISNLFLQSYFASDSRLIDDYQFQLPNNENIARENKFFLDFQFNNHSIYLENREVEEFLGRQRKDASLDRTAADWIHLHLESNFYFKEHTQVTILGDVEQFRVLQGFSGQRTSFQVNNGLNFKNRYIFFQPSIIWNTHFYQASHSNEKLDGRNFNYQYLQLFFSTGLRFERRRKSSYWRLVPKIEYQNIPQTDSLQKFQAQANSQNLELDLFSEQVNELALFNHSDFILPKRIYRFSLALEQKKNQSLPLWLNLSRVYDLRTQDATSNHENFLVIPPQNRENVNSLNQNWLPWHLEVRWRPLIKTSFSYFTRQDTIVGKNLEQVWEFSYHGLSFTRSQNLQNYTNYNKENFFKTNEAIFSFQTPIARQWSTKITTKKNYLLLTSEVSSYFVDKVLDDVTLDFNYQDCCSKLNFSIFERLNKEEIERGFSINFQLISGF